MQTIHLTDESLYDGRQLRPRFIYETTGVLGNALLSFIGPCEVTADHMADLEDVRACAWIRSERMLHFIVEIFDISLLAAVGLQRLFVDHLRQTFEEYDITTLTRRGDDLYDGLYKLSVSIAAPAGTSCVIHTGINISSANTPVPTRGLADYGIDPRDFTEKTTAAFLEEFHSMQRACCKVKEL